MVDWLLIHASIITALGVIAIALLLVSLHIKDALTTLHQDNLIG
jgi:hypothetical protein